MKNLIITGGLISVIAASFTFFQVYKTLGGLDKNNQCICKANVDLNTKSIDKHNSLPWIVSIFFVSREYFDPNAKKRIYKAYCSGSILSPDYLLTAAHCVYQMVESNITHETQVAAGSNHDLKTIFSNEQYFRKVTAHWTFDNRTLDLYNTYEGRNDLFAKNRDVAIMKLERPFELSDRTGIYPACLSGNPLSGFSNKLYIASYNYYQRLGDPFDFPIENPINETWSKIFQKNGDIKEIANRDTKLSLATFDQQKCPKRYSNYICTFSEMYQVCEGDSGSPVMIAQGDKVNIVGLASSSGLGVDKVTKRLITCGVGTSLGYHVNLHLFLHWIKTITHDDVCPFS